MGERSKIRAAVSAVCIVFIMILGISGVLIYNNTSIGKAHLGGSYVSDDELEDFYNEDGSGDDMYEERAESGSLTFTFPGRTLTSEVVPYDGVVRNIACWGDSMTEGIGASYAILEMDDETLDISYWTYPDALEYFTGLTTFNFGVSGENSDEIAVRAGGIELYTDRDVVVGYRHSADVRVVNSDGEEEYVQNYGGYGNIYGGYNYGSVYINGQLYTLNGAVYDDEEEAYQYVDLYLIRVGDGYDSYYDETEGETASDTANPSAVAENLSETAEEVGKTDTPDITDVTEIMEFYNVGYFEEFTYDGDLCIVIPAGTLVTPRAAQDCKDAILIIEIGSNGGWQNDYAKLVAQIDSIIERYNNPYYIIVGDTDDPGDSADANQGMLDQDGNAIGRNDTYWEAALRVAYGDHFLNTREYIITNGLRDVGMLTSKRDLRYFQSGMISKKLRSDWTHFNSYGYYVQAKAIYLKGVELGYWE